MTTIIAIVLIGGCAAALCSVVGRACKRAEYEDAVQARLARYAGQQR